MKRLAWNTRERRTSVNLRVQYRYENPPEQGTAYLVNVSRVGAALLLGRYLRPGRQVWLRFASPLDAGTDVEVLARVLWCRPAQSGVDFLAGVYVHRNDPEKALAFAALGYPGQDTPEETSGRELNKPAVRGVEDLWWSNSPPALREDATTPAAECKAV